MTAKKKPRKPKKKATPPSRSKITGRVSGRRAKAIQEKWSDRLDIICPEYGRRADDNTTYPPGERATAYLCAEIYRLVNELQSHPYGSKLEGVLRAEIDDGTPRLPYVAHPYHWALRVASIARNLSLSDETIERYGYMLKYAKMHGVPPELLVGFLHQAGGPKWIKQKLEEGHTEHWYRANRIWVLTQAASIA